MQATTIFLVQLPDEVGAVAAEAARQAFPGAEIVAVRSVGEAALRTAAGRQLLVLAAPIDVDAAIAAHAADAGSPPRWTAVVLGGNWSDGFDAVPLEECEVPLVARVFRSAVLQHELVRENWRLRGDLMTVARRIRHDLFTPLNCIYMTCEALMDAPPGNEAAPKAKIAAIHDSLSETFRLIDRVSFVLTASTDATPPATVPMGAAVADTLSQLGPEIQKAGASVQQPDNWPGVTGVEQWLEVVWWNLIANALRHGRSSEPIELGWSRQEDGWRFWVADRGPGVPAVQRPRLFRRFEHLHAAPSPGFGLAFVQRLVSLQGGDCGYERRDDGASVFYFTLPATPAPS